MLATLNDSITSAEHRLLDHLSSVQAPVVDGVHQAVAALDALLPSPVPASIVTDRLPALSRLADRGARFVQARLDDDYLFAKKLIESQRQFVKSLAKAADIPAHPEGGQAGRPAKRAARPAEDPAAA